MRKIVIEVSDVLAEKMEKSVKADWSGLVRKYLESQINITETYGFLDKIEPVKE